MWPCPNPECPSLALLLPLTLIERPPRIFPAPASRVRILSPPPSRPARSPAASDLHPMPHAQPPAPVVMRAGASGRGIASFLPSLPVTTEPPTNLQAYLRGGAAHPGGAVLWRETGWPCDGERARGMHRGRRRGAGWSGGHPVRWWVWDAWGCWAGRGADRGEGNPRCSLPLSFWEQLWASGATLSQAERKCIGMGKGEGRRGDCHFDC